MQVTANLDYERKSGLELRVSGTRNGGDDGVSETIRGCGMGGQEQCGLDQFKFHDAKLVLAVDSVDNSVDSRVQRRRYRLHRPRRAFEHRCGRIGGERPTSEVALHAKV